MVSIRFYEIFIVVSKFVTENAWIIALSFTHCESGLWLYKVFSWLNPVHAQISSMPIMQQASIASNPLVTFTHYPILFKP